MNVLPFLVIFANLYKYDSRKDIEAREKNKLEIINIEGDSNSNDIKGNLLLFIFMSMDLTFLLFFKFNT